MNLGKYGESVGVWELRVGGFDKDLKPKKGDARKILNIFLKGKEIGQEKLFDQFQQFMIDLIARDHPPLNDTEKEELDQYVEFNVLKLLEETQIMFRFSSREEMARLKKDMLQIPEGTKPQLGKQPTMKRLQGLNAIG